MSSTIGCFYLNGRIFLKWCIKYLAINPQYQLGNWFHLYMFWEDRIIQENHLMSLTTNIWPFQSDQNLHESVFDINTKCVRVFLTWTIATVYCPHKAQVYNSAQQYNRLFAVYILWRWHTVSAPNLIILISTSNISC